MAGLSEACTHIATLLSAVDITVKIRDSKTVTQFHGPSLVDTKHVGFVGQVRGWPTAGRWELDGGGD